MIDFPNESRSYDATRHCVRFWGHDGALEISFFLDETALYQIAPTTGRNPAALLQTFDQNRKRIVDAARRIYARRRLGSYVLMATDF